MSDQSKRDTMSNQKPTQAEKELYQASIREQSLWHDLGDANYRIWLLRATLYEFLGVFFLVYLMAASGEALKRIGNVVIGNDALGHGLAAFVATYITIHVTGSVLNPALALGLWFTKRLDALTVVVFSLAHVTASIAAAGLLRASLTSLTAGVGVPILTSKLSIGQGILIEATLAILLFFMMSMHYLRGRYYWYKGGYRFHHSNTVRPVESGLMAFAFAGVVEAAFVTTVGTGPNPVRWLGPAIITGTYANWPVWIVGPYVGVLIGAALYGLDAVFLRPDRTPIDYTDKILADRSQQRRQGTSTPIPPEAPMTAPMTDSLTRDFASLSKNRYSASTSSRITKRHPKYNQHHNVSTFT